ncbi:hypothetical protein DBR06_SOUSAS25110040, partial [Sousa chinensis]
RGNTLFQKPLRASSARASLEDLWAVSWALPNATPSQAPSRNLPRPQSGLSAADSGGCSPPSRTSPALGFPPLRVPRGFPEQRDWAAALTFSSSRAHPREEAAAATAQLLCDRSERAVKMDARPRRCHYSERPLRWRFGVGAAENQAAASEIENHISEFPFQIQTLVYMYPKGLFTCILKALSLEFQGSLLKLSERRLIVPLWMEGMMVTLLSKRECPEEVYDPRSLYERLQEQKDRKQQEYEEQFKFKNMVRGLDEDETNFLDEVGISQENKKEVEKKVAVKPTETKTKFSQAKLLAGAVKHKSSESGNSVKRLKSDSDPDEKNQGGWQLSFRSSLIIYVNHGKRLECIVSVEECMHL